MPFSLFCGGWKKYAWIWWFPTLILTVPLVMTYSRTGVLVLAFELAAYFIISKTKNWKLIAAIASGILLILLIGSIFGRFALDKAVTNRPEIWLAGLKLYAANPLGVGLSNSGMIVSNFMLENIQCRTLVNSHLTLLVEFGMIAGFLWFSFIFYALFTGIKKPRAWCAVAGLCISATSASIFDWDPGGKARSYITSEAVSMSDLHSRAEIAPFSVCPENPDLTLASKSFSVFSDGHFETISEQWEVVSILW